MDHASIATALAAAVQHHQARRLMQAEQLYRQILQVDPQHFDATHLLGVLAHEAGQTEAGIELIRRAIQINPSVPEAHYHLGNLLRHQGQNDQAGIEYEAALKLRPNFVFALVNLGLVLTNLGRFEEAIAASRAALKYEPNAADAYTNLGNALRATGRCTEALEAHRTVLRLTPNDAAAHSNLGNSLQALGRMDEAIESYRAAIALNPNLGQVWCNLGAALTHSGSAPEALVALDRALELDPRMAQAHLNRGNALCRVGRPEEGIAAYQRAIQLDPNYADAHNNLGNALKDLGRIDEALQCYRKALDAQPIHPGAGSNLLYTMHFLAEISPQELYDAHVAWGQSQASLAQDGRHDNDPSPDRRLRIGYISGDFTDHPVGRFLLPLLKHRDARQSEIVCFSDVLSENAATREIRSCVDRWHHIAGTLDVEVVKLIRAERIDILVDLSLHAGLNRMRVFARKPAPVQVTYLGYPGTTGLAAIDYRLTDRFLDPPGEPELYVEKSFRLPSSYWCYSIPPDAPPVGPLPASRAGAVTFGCLNNFCKVSRAALGAWSQILRALADSRLLLHTPPGEARQRVLTEFSDREIDRERIEFVAYQSAAQYRLTYNRIDIGLDPFPYNGGTTTCDALAMGVPVVTLAGKTATARAGASILSNANLPELVTRSIDEYVARAVELARDLPRLQELRATLRQRLARSPLTDAPACAGGLEDAYRKMWRVWCANATSAPAT